MRTRILRATGILGTFLCLALALFGQSLSKRPLLEVDVPFDFVAGGMNLPAGVYVIYHISNPDWIMIQSKTAHAVAVFQVRTVSSVPLTTAKSRLVFNRYGEKYFLAQVVTEQDKEMHTCFRSSSEQILARNTQLPPKQSVIYPGE